MKAPLTANHTECLHWCASTMCVSVVIVTWNRKQDVLEAVRSVYDQVYRDFEIVVVDNGSTDETVEALSQAYPDVRIIPLGQNSGVTKGRNVGIQAAAGEIIFLLDSDASLCQDTLVEATGKLAANPLVGIITCKVLDARTGELDRVGWIFTEKDKADQDREFLSFTFGEGAAAIRREVFDRAGLFWEGLFFGGEGDDLSLRAWDAGYQVLYYPRAVVRHRSSSSRSWAGCQREYFSYRNSLSIYLVRYPWWMLGCLAPLKTAVVFVRAVRRHCVRHVLRALTDVVRELPALWRQRRPISTATARRYLGLLREHGPLRWDLVSWVKYKT